MNEIQTKAMMRMILEDDELFELSALLLKKSHSALVKAGFTEDQATVIVAGQGTGIKTS